MQTQAFTVAFFKRILDEVHMLRLACLSHSVSRCASSNPGDQDNRLFNTRCVETSQKLRTIVLQALHTLVTDAATSGLSSEKYKIAQELATDIAATDGAACTHPVADSLLGRAQALFQSETMKYAIV